MNTVLKARNLYKEFNNSAVKSTVLNGIDFELQRGEFIAVMGPSGAGKSTFLHIISGMDKPSCGDVYIDGKNIAGLTDKQLSAMRLEKTGFVFQKTALLDSLCLFDNIVLPASILKKETRGAINKRAKMLMEKTGIHHLALKPVDCLSGGELQRGCICRSLINNPSVLFADEPTGALNSRAAEKVMEIITAVHKSGTGILLVTHDAGIAAYADKVVCLADGSLTGMLKLEGELSFAERKKTVSQWALSLF